MIPVTAGTGDLSQLTRNGTRVPVTRRTVKGVDYRVFDAAAGSYVATYGPGDDTPPDTTVGTATVSGDSATVSFSSNESGAQFECRLDGGPFDVVRQPRPLHRPARRLAHAHGARHRPRRQRRPDAGLDELRHGRHAGRRHHPARHDDRRRDRHRQPRAPDLLLQRRRRALPVPARRRRLRRVHEPGRLQRARRRRAHVPACGRSTARATSIRPGDARLHHARQRIDTGTTSPGGSSPPRAAARARRWARTATLDRTAPRVTVAKRTLRASAKGVVTVRVSCPRTEITLPHRPAPRARRARARAQDGDRRGRQERERLPANEQERARKPDASSHVDDRGHHDGPRRGRQPGNDQDPDPSPGAPTALGQPHQDDAGPRRTTCDTDVSSRRPWWPLPPWRSAPPGPRRPRRPSWTTRRATSRRPVLRPVHGRSSPARCGLKLARLAENFDDRPARRLGDAMADGQTGPNVGGNATRRRRAC